MHIPENLRFRANPSRFSDEIRDQPVKSDLLLFLAITLIGSLCYLTAYIVQKGILEQVQPLDPWSLAILVGSGIFLFAIDGLFILLVISLITHATVIVTSEGKSDYEKTLKTAVCALSVPIMLAWIPLVVHIPGSSTILAATFAILTFYGARKFHNLSNDRALFVAGATSFVLILLLYVSGANLLQS